MALIKCQSGLLIACLMNSIVHAQVCPTLIAENIDAIETMRVNTICGADTVNRQEVEFQMKDGFDFFFSAIWYRCDNPGAMGQIRKMVNGLYGGEGCDSDASLCDAIQCTTVCAPPPTVADPDACCHDYYRCEPDFVADDCTETVSTSMSPAEVVAACEELKGTCFRSDATVNVRSSALRTAVAKPLTQVKVGDVVQTGTSGFSWAEVTGLPHSKSSAPFVEITMDGPERHKLAATEHHTFPACGSHAAEKKKRMLQAHEIKAGTCLLTADGKRTVASVERKLATKEDETYTVELKGGHDTLLVGGVVTHAKPESKVIANAAAAAEMSVAKSASIVAHIKQHMK